MKITRDNYEIYMIDYLEDNLSQDLASEMEKFLNANPDIRGEAEGLASITTEDAPDLKFPEKDCLKNIAKADDYGIPHFDYLAIAKTEGDSTENEKSRLKELCEQNPDCADDLILYGKLKLQADKNIQYPAKDELKNVSVENLSELDRADYLAAAAAEGDMTEEEAQEWEALLKDKPELQKDFALFEKSFLQADEKLAYPDKAALKRTLSMADRQFTYMPVAVAASIIAVFFVIGSLLTPKDILPVKSMADIEFSDELRKYYPTEIPENTLQTAAYYAENTPTSDSENTHRNENENPENTNEKYKYEPLNFSGTTTDIPKADAHVFAQNTQEPEIKLLKGTNNNDYNPTEPERNPKNKAWIIAEKSLDFWKTITSSEVMMANSYNDEGEIERLNIQGNRLEISRTFYKK